MLIAAVSTGALCPDMKGVSMDWAIDPGRAIPELFPRSHGVENSLPFRSMYLLVWRAGIHGELGEVLQRAEVFY